MCHTKRVCTCVLYSLILFLININSFNLAFEDNSTMPQPGCENLPVLDTVDNNDQASLANTSHSEPSPLTIKPFPPTGMRCGMFASNSIIRGVKMAPYFDQRSNFDNPKNKSMGYACTVSI